MDGSKTVKFEEDGQTFEEPFCLYDVILSGLRVAAAECMNLTDESHTTLEEAVKASELIGSAAEILEQLQEDMRRKSMSDNKPL